MSERRTVLFRPLAIWGALLLLGAASLAYALIPRLPLKLPVALGIFILQAALVLGGFMNLGRSSVLARMAALTGIVWLSFLFVMTFADLLTR